MATSAALTLRQDDDAGDEFEPLRNRGEKAEQNERLMEGVGVLVGAPEIVRGRIAAEHVIEGEDVFVPQRLGRLPIVANDRGIVADLGLWKNDTKLHSGPPSLTVARGRHGRDVPCYHALSVRHRRASAEWPRTSRIRERQDGG